MTTTRPISEEDAEEFRRQDREDKGLAHLEERRRREPAIGEPCERCDGSGLVPHKFFLWNLQECPRCLGAGVQP